MRSMRGEVTIMAPLTAANAFLALEFVAGNRLVPHHVFAALLASLPSVSGHTSQRLRKGLALRALDAVLSDPTTPPLRKAQAVLASCFPDYLSLPVLRDDDDAAAVADLKRLVDVEWGNIPPSTLEIAADRIAGTGALDTWASADRHKRKKLRLLVGESMEREILWKLEQDPLTMLPQVNGANKADRAPQDVEPHLVRENGNADHVQKDNVRYQPKPVNATTVTQFPEKLVTSATINRRDESTSSYATGQVAPDKKKSHLVTDSKRSLMERNPTGCAYEWDDSGDSNPVMPYPNRQLPTYDKKPMPSTFPFKTRKKWSEIQKKTLMEGVKKYGKGNWKDIKIAYPDVFEDRSTVDMKDKFRNIERH